MTQHPEVEINTAHITDVMMPATFYVVTAYRWGQRNAHSYVVAAFTSLGAAQACAVAHVDYRGGKYACEVVEAGAWNEETDNAGKQVFYVESPYYGMAGDAGHFHPADQSKDARPCPKPFTVRELQNRIWDLERQLKAGANDTEVVEWMDKHWHDWQKFITTDSDGWAHRFGHDAWHEAHHFRLAVRAVMEPEKSGVLVVDGDHDRDHPTPVVAPAGEPDNQLFVGEDDHANGGGRQP